jgi:hypothetical protein
VTLARPLSLLHLAAFCLLAAPLAAQQPGGLDIIRGRVIGPDSEPVAGARVSVRATGGAQVRETVTNSQGGYTVLFPGATGDYVVNARFIGLAPASAHVVRSGSEAVLVGNLLLAVAQGATAELERVTVTEHPRPRPPREDEQPYGESTHDLGGGDIRDPRDAWKDPLDPRTYSVLGTDPSENTVTVNGVEVKTVLPNPVGMSGRMSTAGDGASHGGYSGGRLSVAMNGGGDYHLRYLDLTAAPASLQWVDGPSADAGAESTTLGASLWTFDPLLAGRVHQNTVLTYQQSTAALPALPTTEAGQARLGIAADSLARFLALMRDAGIPATVAAMPSQQRTTRASWLSRIDFGKQDGTNLNILLNVGTDGTGGAGLSPSALGSHGGSSRQTGGFATAKLSKYVGNGFLTDISATFNPSASRSSPYLALPEGRVRVLSSLPTGDSALAWLTFGGSPMESRQRSTIWQANAKTTWMSFDGKQRFSVGGDVFTERQWAEQSTDQRGRFEFESLEALAMGDASRFTRETPAPADRGSGVRADLYVDNKWTMRPSLTMTYGLRLDLSRIAAPIAYNAAIDSLFGLRTDVLPRLTSVSPRLGLRWHYGATDGRSLPSELSIDVGRMQSSLNAGTAIAASRATGLASATRVLDCVGEGVPLASWAQYESDQSSIPDACADGSGGVAGVTSTPWVHLYGSRYQPPVQWRSAVSWNSQKTGLRVSLIHSRGTAEQSDVDRNLRSVPEFTLPAEGGRPVYAPVGAIVPATGATALADSRRTARFGQVVETRADLRSSETELYVSRGFWWGKSLGIGTRYMYAHGRRQARGFDRPTGGDPFAVTWGPIEQPHHNLRLSVRAKLSQRYALIANGWMTSGVPYSPTVAGDVNGDGAFRDLAFIPAPSTPLGDQLQAGLHDAPKAARQCLADQLGNMAARGSCTGPWSGGLDLQLELSPPGMPSEAGIFVDVVNAAGAVDQLVHGSGHARGWGDPAYVDPTLFVANGFDPATRQFRYQVNPRFGQRGDAGAWHRPIEIRVRVSTPVGPSLTTQQNHRVSSMVRADEGGRLLPFFDPFASVLKLEDKLHLTVVQIDSLHRMQALLRQSVDSVQSALADYADDVSDTVRDEEIVARVDSARKRITAVTKLSLPIVRGILTEGQLEALPEGLRAQLEDRPGGVIGLRGTTNYTGSDDRG